MLPKSIGLRWVSTSDCFTSSPITNEHWILVLHPRYKLRYFKQLNWEPEWIEAAASLVRNRWQTVYKSLEVEATKGSGNVRTVYSSFTLC
jgi:hypothetical protein